MTFRKGAAKMSRSRTVKQAVAINSYRPADDLACSMAFTGQAPSEGGGLNNTPEFGTGTHRRYNHG